MLNANRNKPLSPFIKFVHTYPILTLIFFILASSAIVFFPYLFKLDVFIFNDIGSDTTHVYYPFFTAIHRKIANGDFTLWDFTHGLGTNAITRQADIGSIFTWILCLFRSNHLKYALVLVHILKVVLTGVIGYLYLDCFKLSAPVKITAAYVFAFNGFIMLWGQHYFFATACATTCFLFYAVEKCLVSKKGYLLFTCAVFFCAFNSYYYAYMMLLVTAVYALFRLLATHTLKDSKKFFLKIAVLFGAVVLGVGMAACLFLPSVNMVVSTSARLSDEMSLVEKLLSYLKYGSYDKATVEGILVRFFSNNLYGAKDYTGPLNYYEMPQWFFTSFFPFFATLFVTDTVCSKNETLKLKILKLSSVALVLFLAFHPMLSVVLNGFVLPFFRYTYLIMPLFALCMALVLEKLFTRQFSLAQLLIAEAVHLAVFAFAVSTIPDNKKQCFRDATVYLILSVVLILLFVILQNKRLKKTFIPIALSVLLIFSNVTMDSYITNTRRATLSATNPKVYQPFGSADVQLALQYINSVDTTFFRTDKNYQDIAFLNDSMLQGYYGVSVYNSVVNKDIIDFVTNVCPNFKITDANGYYDFREIYKDVNVVSLLGVKYILSTVPITDVDAYELIHTAGTVLVYRNNACNGIGKFYSKAIPYAEYESLSPTQKNAVLQDTLIMDKAFHATPDPDAQYSFEKPDRQSFVHGFANVSQAGYLMLPIPNEDGWKAYVDGKEVEIESCDYAFMAIPLAEGHHEIELRYNTPFFFAGLVVSVSCFAVYGLLWYLLLRKEKKLKNSL